MQTPWQACQSSPYLQYNQIASQISRRGTATPTLCIAAIMHSTPLMHVLLLQLNTDMIALQNQPATLPVPQLK